MFALTRRSVPSIRASRAPLKRSYAAPPAGSAPKPLDKKGPSAETYIVGGVGAVIAYYVGKSILYQKNDEEQPAKA